MDSEESWYSENLMQALKTCLEQVREDILALIQSEPLRIPLSHQ